MAQVTTEDFTERLLRAIEQAAVVERGEAAPALAHPASSLPHPFPGWDSQSGWGASHARQVTPAAVRAARAPSA